MSVYAREEEITSFDAWMQERREREKDHVDGAERITEDPVYDMYFAVDKVCFDEMFRLGIALYWMPEDAKMKLNAIGAHHESAIMLDRAYYEEEGRGEAFCCLLFHEMIHAFCKWKGIEDTVKGVHLKAFADAVNAHGGEGYFENGDYSGTRFKPETWEKIARELRRKGAYV